MPGAMRRVDALSRHEATPGVVPHAIVIAGYDEQAISHRGEHPLERVELRGAPAMGHVAGDEHRVHVPHGERVREGRRGRVGTSVSADVQIRDMRERPRHVPLPRSPAILRKSLAARGVGAASRA